MRIPSTAKLWIKVGWRWRLVLDGRRLPIYGNGAEFQFSSTTMLRLQIDGRRWDLRWTPAIAESAPNGNLWPAGVSALLHTAVLTAALLAKFAPAPTPVQWTPVRVVTPEEIARWDTPATDSSPMARGGAHPTVAPMPKSFPVSSLNGLTSLAKNIGATATPARAALPPEKDPSKIFNLATQLDPALERKQGELDPPNARNNAPTASRYSVPVIASSPAAIHRALEVNDEATLRSAFAALTPALSAAYDQALKLDPRLSQLVRYQVHVGTDGGLDDIQLQSEGEGSPAARAHLERAVRSLLSGIRVPRSLAGASIKGENYFRR